MKSSLFQKKIQTSLFCLQFFLSKLINYEKRTPEKARINMPSLPKAEEESMYVQLRQPITDLKYRYIYDRRLGPGTGKRRSRLVSLVNSAVFHLDFAFIARENSQFRLVVSRNERIIADKFFGSLTSAKLEFVKVFQYIAFSDAKPVWSHPFNPYGRWLQGVLRKPASKYYN
jgi:hypothetical protein